MRLSWLTIRILVPIMLLLLTACFTGYSQNGNKVAWHDWNEGTGRNVHYLEGADPVTFLVLAKDSYAKDKTYVWYQTSRLAGADAGSFQVLSDTNYGKDNSHVFFQDVLIPNADPATFRLLGFAYSRDDSQVFCGTVPMKVHAINSFEVIMESIGYGGLDFGDLDALKEAIESNNMPHYIVGIGGWARDGISYYYGAHEVKGAEYESFIVLNEDYAKDNIKVYYWGRVVSLADPATFEVLRKTSMVVDAKDKDHQFSNGEIKK